MFSRMSVIGLLLAFCAASTFGAYSGTYTIKPVGGDFLSHAEAAESLMAYGVVGPCTLLMYTGEYAGQARFEDADWDSVRVVFRAARGESVVVADSDSPWYFDQTRRMRVEGVGIASSSGYGAYAYQSPGTEFVNCSINASSYGLYLYYSDSCRVVGCNINAGSNGIRWYYSGMRYCVGNSIHAPNSYGLYLYLSSDGAHSYHDTIVNNMVYAGGGYGVYSYYSYHPYWAYNTVLTTGSYGVYCSYTHSSKFYSNIFVTLANTYILYQHMGSTDSADYNCWYNPFGWMTYPYTWEMWQAAGYDPHGMYRDPLVGGPEELHLRSGSPCIDSGMVIPGFPTDIDGDRRDSTPCIGADEWRPTGEPMAGVYTIIPDGSGDFRGFNDALSAGALRGIAGDVTFCVYPGTYNELVAVSTFGNGSYKVVFQGLDTLGNPTGAVLSSGGYGINLTDVKHFEFRHLTINANSYGVRFYYGTTNVGVDSCVVADCDINANSYGIYIYYYADYNQFLRNDVRCNSSYGLYLCGSSSYYSTGNVFSDNAVYGWTWYGMYSNYHQGSVLRYNTFYGTGSYGFYNRCSYDIKLRNNIFRGSTYGYYHYYGDMWPATSDYNCFHSDNRGYVIYHNSYGALTLSTWQSYSGRDLNSIAADPRVAAFNDMHLRPGSPCRDSGVAIAGDTLDFDRDRRDDVSPDIGADEWRYPGEPLTGVHTIIPDGSGDFRGFNEALSAGALRGIAGDVTFCVYDGTYREDVTIRGFPNGSHKVVFQGRDTLGNSTDVTLACGSWGLDLANVKCFEFHNLDIQSSSSYGVRLYYLYDGNYNGVDSCVFADCEISGYTSYGVYMYYGDDDNLFARNRIVGGGYGVYLYGYSGEPSRGNRFENNMIWGWTSYGLRLYYHDSTCFIYNSICSDYGSYCLYDYYSDDLHLENNIVSSENSIPVYLYGGTLPVVSDNNCWWAGDTLAPVINGMTLPEWREYSGLDMHSIARDPLFISGTNLHLQAGSPCANSGRAIAEIPLDIDHDLRDSTPCIGADEWVGTGSEVSPQATAAVPLSVLPNPAAGPVRVRWQVPFRARVTLRACDVTGRLVRVLLDRDLVPGDYDCRWDGLDDAGRRVPTGVYFIQLIRSDQELRHKVVLQR